MCLALPGEILSIEGSGSLPLAMGTVRFGVITKEICLALVPGADVGDWVLVHAGFAISRLDREAAQRTLDEFARAFDSAESKGT